MQTAEVLERAADLIEVNGLAKMMLVDNEGRHCSIGAIGVVLGVPIFGTGSDAYLSTEPQQELDIGDVATALASVLPKCCDLGHSTWNEVVLWNNNIDRTSDEVVDAMRRAAKELRNQAIA